MGLSFFGGDLYFSSMQYFDVASTHIVDFNQFFHRYGSWHILCDIAFLGLSGGLYVVPLFALIQTRCDPTHISRTIAGLNILNAMLMVIAALLGAIMLAHGFSIPQIFLVTAGLNVVVTIYIFSLVPEFFMRFLAWLLIHSIRQVRKVGIHHIPETGAAVLVCNHVSYLDAVVILACSPRPIRFVTDHRIFNVPVLSWIYKMNKVIPIASAKEDKWVKEHAFIDIAKALHNGDLVCVFPEGRVTKDGEMQTFRSGIQQILDQSPVPVIPMALRGLWGSIFSHARVGIFEGLTRRGLFSKLELAIGDPISPELATPEFLQQKVQALRGDCQ